MSYLSFDLETGSIEYKGRKGSPWVNKILAIGLKYQKPRDLFQLTRACLVHVNDDDNKSLFAIARDYMPSGWLEGVKVLIGHNIKFDLLHVWRNDELQDYFKSGGRIWDTQLAEYILTGQRQKYAALRDIGTNKYGCVERTKKIEEGLKAGIMTQDMDIEDLLFDVKNDVLDTEAIALQQVKISKKSGMYNLIMLEMDSLLATTEMEANGLYVDREIMKKNKLDLQIEYEHKRKEFDNLVKEYWK